MKITDKIILKELQSNFPLSVTPYKTLAKKLNLKEKTLLARIKKIREHGLIRRIGGVVSGKHLGYKSVLIAAKIKPQSLRPNAAFLNSFDNITHNYLRDAEQYNVWFTFSAKTKKEINAFILQFKKRPGVEKTLVLPSKKTFKINAEFNIG